MITKQSKSKPNTKPTSRKKKTKHKQKFLSLKLHLIAKTPKPPMPTTNNDNKQLINLFPLHPENLIEQDKLDMSCIFSACDDSTTLTGILCSDDDDDDDDDESKNIPSPSSVNYADEEVKLVRTAMKRKNYKNERNDYNDHDHEKWVCYSEVVERKNEIRGMSSSSSTTSCYHHKYFDDHENNRSKFVLKLDYEKIMNSWVNKGPLYIHNNSDPDTPQTVPELKDDFFLPPSINGSTHDERDNGGSWMVPEMTQTENIGVGEGDDGLQAMGSSATTHNREASVQRYKEKRRNRLFAKTIRYEVRKLNAEKRPRIKGRFVKRN